MSDLSDAAGYQRPLRLVSYNILAGRGWSAGERPDTNPGPERPWVMAAMTTALAALEVDVIALQECPTEAEVAAAAQRLGMHHAWFSPRWPGSGPWLGGFPGAILSRWPLAEVRDEVALRPDLTAGRFVRHWGNALVRSPVGDLRVHAYHCCVGAEHEDVRCDELRSVLSQVRAGEATALLGDHNARPGSAPLQLLTAAGFVDAHAVAGCGEGSTFPAIDPLVRIDYAWVRNGRVLTSRVVTEPPFGRTDGDPEPTLSDHLPVLVEVALDDTAAADP